jgi:hypothetical protein
MSWNDKNWTPQNYSKLDDQSAAEDPLLKSPSTPEPVVVPEPSQPGESAGSPEVASEGTADGGDAVEAEVTEEFVAEESYDDHTSRLNLYVWLLLAFVIPATIGGLITGNTYYGAALRQSATSAYQLSQPSLFNFAVVTFIFQGVAYGLIGLGVALALTKWAKDKMMQLAAVAAAFGTAGLLLIAPPAHEMYWPSTLGEVGHTEMSASTTDNVIVVFGYVINGELLKSPNLTPFSLASSYPDGKKVKVFYDPKNIRYARLERLKTPVDYAIMVPTVLMLLLAFVVVILKLSRRQSSPKAATAFDGKKPS